MKKQIGYIIFVVFLVASCGTSNSMRHTPEMTSFNNTVPVVIKQSNTFF
jgi:hypothetical protein